MSGYIGNYGDDEGDGLSASGASNYAAGLSSLPSLGNSVITPQQLAAAEDAPTDPNDVMGAGYQSWYNRSPLSGFDIPSAINSAGQNISSSISSGANAAGQAISSGISAATKGIATTILNAAGIDLSVVGNYFVRGAMLAAGCLLIFIAVWMLLENSNENSSGSRPVIVPV